MDLSMKFEDWKNKKINCFDLSEFIHEFHSGISKDLFNSYNAKGIDDAYIISRGVALGLLKEEDIPFEAKEFIKHCADTLFEQHD